MGCTCSLNSQLHCFGCLAIIFLYCSTAECKIRSQYLSSFALAALPFEFFELYHISVLNLYLISQVYCVVIDKLQWQIH